MAPRSPLSAISESVISARASPLDPIAGAASASAGSGAIFNTDEVSSQWFSMRRLRFSVHGPLYAGDVIESASSLSD
jgi:hypothetical protein